MRTTEKTTLFRRDFKRELKGRHRQILLNELPIILRDLIADRPLEPRLRDHALGSNWIDHRDCHIRPDLVLIYRKPDSETLQLVRLGSHSELRL